MRRASLPPTLAVAAAAVLAYVVFLMGSSVSLRAAAPGDEHPGLSGGQSASPGAAPTPAAQPSSDALKKEFTEVIEGQLAAFRAGDYNKAYTFAATPIKGMFPVEEFETMVRNAYPVIANSSAAEFGLAFDVGDDAVINVRVENAEKKSVLYQYTLHKEEGTWKITGVSEVKSTGLSV